jgi:hypothetical protein
VRKPCARLTMGRELAMTEQLTNHQECGTVIVRLGWSIPWQGQHSGALFDSRVSCSGLCEMLRTMGDSWSVAAVAREEKSSAAEYRVGQRTRRDFVAGLTDLCPHMALSCTLRSVDVNS